MALMHCDFFSESLGLSTSMTVIVPQPTRGQIGMTGATGEGAPPVLYLLHGLSDDHTIWARRTSIERYVSELGLAVVMPSVHRSFYCDEEYGGRFWTFVSEELPELVAGFFRFSDRREDTFAAGLSMGGYGALKLGLRCPDRFAAVASLSGAVNLAGLRTSRPRPDDPRFFERIHGTAGVPATDDLFEVLAAADPATLPSLYLSCGTEDALVADNRAFVAAVEERGVPITSAFVPGTHEWGLWDAEIQRVLDWLPLTRPAAP